MQTSWWWKWCLSFFFLRYKSIALGKPTAQSSFWPQYPGPSSFAVDGLHATDPSGAVLFCTHTLQEATPWWGVDLEANYAVAIVNVMNRANSRQSIQYQTKMLLKLYLLTHYLAPGYVRLTDFDVMVASDVIDPTQSSNKQLCAHVEGTVPQGGWMAVDCNPPINGR